MRALASRKDQGENEQVRRKRCRARRESGVRVIGIGTNIALVTNRFLFFVQTNKQTIAHTLFFLFLFISSRFSYFLAAPQPKGDREIHLRVPNCCLTFGTSFWTTH